MEWIKASDKLPELIVDGWSGQNDEYHYKESQAVLVLVKGTEKYTNIYEKVDIAKYRVFDDGECYFENKDREIAEPLEVEDVEAWMPIKIPPRDGELIDMGEYIGRISKEVGK